MEFLRGSRSNPAPESGGGATSHLSAALTPVVDMFHERKRKEKKPLVPRFGLFKEDKTTKDKWPEFGPGGGLGIGCGAGIGVGLTGGAGLGSTPWNAFRLVLGLGVGCGIGIGYGYGHGFGVLWDRRPKKVIPQKRVVIEI